jgi:hypothetical protein
MTAVRFRLRAELRARGKSVVAVGLVAGLAGASTLATAAGVRRGNSNFDRFRSATRTPEHRTGPVSRKDRS